MNSEALRILLRVRAWTKPITDAVAGRATAALLKGIRLTDPDRIADRAGRFMQRLGPRLKEHRIGRQNLAAAFPEKSAAEIEEILRGVWDNLGRVAAEYAHLDKMEIVNPDTRVPAIIDYDDVTLARFRRLRDDGRPGLIFTAHLANWELPALVATDYGLDATILYRAPSIDGVARAVQDIRAVKMGELVATDHLSPVRLAAALERGSHAAMLVDQYFTQGIDVSFFGRPARTNPLLARLARHFDCPIHGTRMIRLGGRRFRCELTEEVVPPRDARGRIDIHGTMQAITTVVEGWVREHPEQWLWLHRRWRDPVDLRRR